MPKETNDKILQNLAEGPTWWDRMAQITSSLVFAVGHAEAELLANAAARAAVSSTFGTASRWRRIASRAVRLPSTGGLIDRTAEPEAGFGLLSAILPRQPPLHQGTQAADDPDHNPVAIRSLRLSRVNGRPSNQADTDLFMTSSGLLGLRVPR